MLLLHINGTRLLSSHLPMKKTDGISVSFIQRIHSLQNKIQIECLCNNNDTKNIKFNQNNNKKQAKIKCLNAHVPFSRMWFSVLRRRNKNNTCEQRQFLKAITLNCVEC